MGRRRVGAIAYLVLLSNLLAGILTLPASASTTSVSQTCTPRVLVVSAMPLELDPLLANARSDLSHPVMLNSRPFVFGTLEGDNVIMGLTGIGPENAKAAISDAFSTFRCSNGASEISDVVFSGTSGGDYIGDVFVPNSWSYGGATPIDSNSTLLSIAHEAQTHDPPTLEQSTPPGDPACACEITNQTQLPITIQHTPVVEFGGAGLTTDPFGGRTLPCAPAGNDVFGCTPCPELDHGTVGQVQNIGRNGPAFLEPSFFTGYANSTAPPGNWVSQDEETAIVAQIAAANGTPFIGFRAASDGGGDPLHLPGFPWEFFIYRQLAANNAAATAMSFLHQLSLSH
jgi:nucleoside phosphorylase